MLRSAFPQQRRKKISRRLAGLWSSFPAYIYTTGTIHPALGLDFLSRENLLASIDELARRPDAPTMLFVTHHIEEVLPVLGRSLLIRRGTIFEQGKTRETLTTETLSAFFETGVRMDWRNDRAWLSVP